MRDTNNNGSTGSSGSILFIYIPVSLFYIKYYSMLVFLNGVFYILHAVEGDYILTFLLQLDMG